MRTTASKNSVSTPNYSLGEEIFNSVSHGVGVILAIVAFFLLFNRHKDTPVNLVYLSVYCVTLLTLYSISTMYHSLTIPKAKEIFRKLDHCSIFLLIAGTYTPICLVYVTTPTSKFVLGLVYTAAIVGIILNSIDVNKFSKISMLCYIAMGWSVVLMAKPTFIGLNRAQLLWLILGGVFYTIGAVLYLIGKRKKYVHSIWHLFVLFGSICHFLIFYI